VSHKFINTAKFPPDSDYLYFQLRDTTVNDAFDGVAAWAWSDNSNVQDQSSGNMNVAVAVGTIKKDGKLKVNKPVFLTNFTNGNYVFDRAVAINRTNKDNIVVSYGVIENPSGLSYLGRAVSFDGGKTWPYNGPTNIQPSGYAAPGVPGGWGDARGVASDKYGNIWYGSTNSCDNIGNFINTPFFMVSSDGGVTFELVYTFPTLGTEPNPTSLYDFPQYCFGEDGSGNYGLYFTSDLFPNFANFTGDPDANPFVGFIPISGPAYVPGSIGTPQTASLNPPFANNVLLSAITASNDGRVWLHTITEAALTYPYPGTAVTYKNIVYKSPGAIDENYAGPWDFARLNLLGFAIEIPNQYDSQPPSPFWPTAQTIVYDNARQALYAMISTNYPDVSQNTKLSFAISRDNGQTWSNPIAISNTDFANRGYPSMALDTKKGDLYFGWYDGRNDPTLQGLQYYAAVMNAKTLDSLVKQIPLSNPTYSIPASGS
jgi:hypothetical protein